MNKLKNANEHLQTRVAIKRHQSSISTSGVDMSPRLGDIAGGLGTDVPQKLKQKLRIVNIKVKYAFGEIKCHEINK